MNRAAAGGRWVWAGVLCLVLSGCGGGGGAEGGSDDTAPPPAAQVAQVAGIVLHGANAEVVTDANFPLRGAVLYRTAGQTPAIRWRLKATPGVAGIATPAAADQFAADVPLADGDNVVEVWADDGQAQPIVFSKSVTRNAAPAFNGALQLSHDVAYVNESRQVVARVALRSDLVDAASVRLLLVAADGAETEVGNMADGGDLTMGDDIEGDGVYSVRFNVAPGAKGSVRYRVNARLAGAATQVRSEKRSIKIAERLTDQQFSALLHKQTAGAERLTSAAAGGEAALRSAVTELIAQLGADPDVAAVAPNETGLAVSVVYRNGVAGVIGTPAAGTKGGALAVAGGRGAAPAFEAALRPYDAHCKRLPGTSRNEREQALGVDADGVPTIGSNRVYALAANYSQWGENDDVPAIAAALMMQGCLDVNYKRTTVAGQGSVEDFKNLGDYGMVLISSHGDTHFTIAGFSLFSAGLPVFEGWAPSSAQVVIYSNMAATPTARAQYEDDLQSGRLVLWGSMFGVMPSFIQHYAGALPDSIVYMSICRGTWNDSMANAFLARGAKAYLGYSDYVNVPFTVDVGTRLFQALLSPGSSMNDAFVAGQVETDADPAEFKLVGTRTISAAVTGLQNGSFDGGALSGWVAEGDGRVIAQLGAAAPAAGTHMAVISTGLGFTTESGSLHQLLCIGTATTLSYRWNFMSEEFLEYVGSQYQDAFIVTIEEAGNAASRVQLQNDTIDSLASGVSAVSNSFDRGDVHATGWRQASHAIPAALQGKMVLVRFYVTDVGDSVYDTAVLLDDIRVE